MKVLWHSNAPWAATGYGNQTGLFVEPLSKKYELAVSAFYGLEGAVSKWKDITVLPGMGGTYGDEAIGAHATGWFEGDPRGGLVVTLMDVWVLKRELWKDLKAACWCPVDHVPVPPLVKLWFKETGAVPIAMTRFGQRQLEEYDALYCPHAIDTTVYRPQPRDKARDAASFPKDAFIVGVVAANKGNPSRKCFPEMIRAFEAFRQRHDDVFMYLHTNMGGANGVPIAGVFDSLGTPEDRVFIADQARYLYNPLPAQHMALTYSTFDVLLNTAAGEGFGIPILEAQACGVPGIVTDFSAMPEVCGSGWHVEGEPVWTHQASWMLRPRVEAILEALEEAYARPSATVDSMSKAAREHAEGYEVTKVVEEHMIPSLDVAGERLGVTGPIGGPVPTTIELPPGVTA